ncbi:MAG: hypothetical protein E7513_02530 [Ruminococcaceae bacterium]|nr:hypothetical protein [Oscillospiraceae bacterium]
MLKKIVSLTLALVMVLGLFTVMPATTASAASYKDNIINAVLNNEYLWYDDMLSYSGHYGYGTAEFLDLNFDGNLEFVVTYPCGTMGNVFRDIYYYSNGSIYEATGGDSNGYEDIGYSGMLLDAYYNKSTGKYKLIGRSMLSAGIEGRMLGNFTLSFDGSSLYVDYYSAEALTNHGPSYTTSTTTYYNGAKSWGDVSGASKISKSKYDTLNKNATKNCVDAKLSTKSISMENWKSYSTSKKRSLLNSSYDSFSLKKSLLKQPVIKKFEAKSNGVKITWDAVSGAKKYRVYRKTSSGWKTVATTSGTSITDTDIKAGEKRIYTLRCLSANGKYYVSPYDTAGRAFQRAATPKISKASYVTGGVKLTWPKATGAVKYRVFVKYGDKSWTKLKDTTSTSFTHKTGKKGRVYTYTVRCISSSGKTYTSHFDATGKTVKFKR